MRKKKAFFLKSVLALSVLSFAGKGIGFVREMMMASFYGTTFVADSYLMAGSIATILTSLLSAICLVYTPIYFEKEDETARQNLTGEFLFLIGSIGTIMIGAAYLLRPYIIKIFAGGFSQQAVDLTIYFYVFALITGVLSVINQLFVFNLNNKGYFIRAAVSNLIISITQIIFIYLSFIFDSLAFLNISQSIAMLVQLSCLYYYYKKGGLKIKIVFNYNHCIKILIMSLPIVLTVAIEDLNSFIDRIFASHLQVGTVAALNYAHLLKQMLFFITVTALSTVLFPSLAKLIQSGKKEMLSSILESIIKGLIIVLIPVTLTCVLYSDSIIALVYKRGLFDTQSALVTSQSFRMYVLALLPLAVREIFIKVFIAFKNAKSNFYISAVTVFINIICNFLLYKKLAHMGLALSTAISAYCSLFLYLYFLQKKHIQNFSLHLQKFVIEIVILGILFFLIPYILWFRNSNQSLLLFILIITCSMLGYLLSIFLIKKDIKKIMGSIKSENL